MLPHKEEGLDEVLGKTLTIKKSYCSVVYRDATILQYIDILQYLLLQYNTIHLIKILIYCNIYCLQSCKYPIITLQKLVDLL